MKNYIIPIFIPHLGCKNECVFCNQRKISGTLKPVLAEDIKKQIEEFLNYFDKDEEKIIEVAFFGGSFTGLEIEKQKEYLEVVQPFIQDKKINYIRCSTRPDYINREILDLLKEKNVKIIELGVQSLDEEVLVKAKRGHTVKDVENASKLIKEYGFTLGHQIMIGLPGSTFDKEISTVVKSLNLHPDIVRLYPVLVINDTKLNEMYKNGEYVPLTVEEAVERTATIYKMYVEEKVNVIRVGLHVTEDLKAPDSYVAGPIHPAFGQKVISKIILREIIKKVGAEDKEVIIECNPRYESDIRGVSNENIKYISNTLGKTVKIKKSLEQKTYDIKSR